MGKEAARINENKAWKTFENSGDIVDYLIYKLGPDCPFNKNKKDDIYTGASVKIERERNNNSR